MTAPERLSDTAPWRDWFEQAMNSGAPIVDRYQEWQRLTRELEQFAAEFEEWRPVEGFPLYMVSSFGRVRSHNPKWATPRLLTGRVGPYGYLEVSPTDASGRAVPNMRVHRLVAEAFIGPRPAGMDTCHNDGDKLNNSVGNLRYGTRSENQLDNVRHGIHHNARKTHCKRDHPFDEANTGRWSDGHRYCRACERLRSAERVRRSRASKEAAA